MIGNVYRDYACSMLIVAALSICTTASEASDFFETTEQESLTNRIESIEKDVSVINERLGRSVRLPTRANSIEERLEKIEKDISSIQKELEKVKKEVSTLDSKVKTLERNKK